MDGEINRRMDLLRRLILARREAFEMHDQELGRTGDDDLLRGFTLTFAVRAFPHFLFAEPFLLAIAPQAVVDICACAPLRDFDADTVEGFIGCGGVLTGGTP